MHAFARVSDDRRSSCAHGVLVHTRAIARITARIHHPPSHPRTRAHMYVHIQTPTHSHTHTPAAGRHQHLRAALCGVHRSDVHSKVVRHGASGLALGLVHAGDLAVSARDRHGGGVDVGNAAWRRVAPQGAALTGVEPTA